MSNRSLHQVIAAVALLSTLPCASGCQKLFELANPTQHAQQTIVTGKPQPQAQSTAATQVATGPVKATAAVAPPPAAPPQISIEESNRRSASVGVTWIFSAPAGAELTKSEITVAQYSGFKCPFARSEEASDEGCHSNFPDRANMPMNCVSWNCANEYCRWLGGELPASGNMYREMSNSGVRSFPWGREDFWGVEKVNCDHAVLSTAGVEVLDELTNSTAPDGPSGCGRDTTWPVCSKPRGNSVSGLCDVIGNVSEWMSDDLSARTRPDMPMHLACGASYQSSAAGLAEGKTETADFLPCSTVVDRTTNADYPDVGFRCMRARSGSQAPDAGTPVWTASNVAGLQFLKTEVTVQQFTACVQRGACSDKYFESGDETDGQCNYNNGDRLQHPMNCVSWYGAMEYCKFAGGRLPTRDEWNREASDGGQRPYPWGSQTPSCTTAVLAFDERFLSQKLECRTRGWIACSHRYGCGRDGTWPVCSHHQGDSISGLCDMIGNVWEWTATVDKDGWSKIIVGGGWANDAEQEHAQNDNQSSLGPDKVSPSGGFRCVYGPEQTQATAAAPAPTSAATPPSTAPIVGADATSAALKNVTYHFSVMTDDDTVIAMKNGKYDGEDGESLSLASHVSPIVADVDGDGLMEAIGILSYTGGGSSNWLILVVVDGPDSSPKQKAATIFGDRDVVKGMSMDGDVITLDMVVHKESDPDCCPSRRVKMRLQLRGGELVEVGAKSGH